MNADSGGRKSESPLARDWILRCEGFRVDGPDGVVGHIVGPIYDFSARWDCPRALAVRTPRGTTEVELGSVDRVEVRERRIVVRAEPR